MSRRLLAVPLLVVALGGGLSACGSSGGGTSSTPGTPKLGAGPGSAPEAEKLLAQTAAALKKVHSYHASGVSVDKDGRTTISADVSYDGRIRVTSDAKDGKVSLIVVGRSIYVKGDLTYWQGVGGPSSRLAQRLAGRWVKTPASFGTSLLKLVEQLLPKTFAHCLPQKLGKLTVTGTRVFKGQKVTVITDDGNTPGGTPSEIWVAASGAVLPARSLGHGKASQGGGFDPLCDDPDDTTIRSSTRYGLYNHIAPIRPPKHPLDLGALHGATPGGRSA